MKAQDDQERSLAMEQCIASTLAGRVQVSIAHLPFACAGDLLFAVCHPFVSASQLQSSHIGDVDAALSLGDARVLRVSGRGVAVGRRGDGPLHLIGAIVAHAYMLLAAESGLY